jgi:hypothetical protein
VNAEPLERDAGGVRTRRVRGFSAGAPDPDRWAWRGSKEMLTAENWLYEKEYRIFRPEMASQSLDYPVELLTGIIFGCMVPNNIRASVKQWVKEGNCRVAFFEARPKTAEFGLDIVRID